MKIFQFFGNSDDTFGEYAVTSDDFDNCASGEPIDYLLTAPGVDGGVVVTGQYARATSLDTGMSWQIGVGAFDPDNNDAPIPNWRIWFDRSDNGYSPRLNIEAPDDAVLRCLERDVDD